MTGNCRESLYALQKGAFFRAVRVSVAARDVSTALAEPSHSSILPATVVAVDHDEPDRSLVRLALGATPILARLTRKSAVELGLAAGMRVYAQVKGVALLR